MTASARGRARRRTIRRRLSQTIYPGTGSTTESYTYDAAGHVRTKTDRRGIVTTFDYGALG